MTLSSGESMSIKVQTVKVLRALLEVPYDTRLIALAIWFCVRHNFPMITSAYRANAVHAKDSRIHSTIPCRAMDFSVCDIPDPESACQDVNQYWQYDPKRPWMKCALYHDVGLGPHIHLQVHRNTVYTPAKETESDELSTTD